jgi:protein-S-isoprenylcysteine O-methyltransferase Ste14
MLLSQLVILVSVLVYGIFHSFLASLEVKDWTRRVLGPGVERWYRLAFNFLGVLTFLPVLGLATSLPDRQLYSVPAPWAYLMVAGQLSALILLAIGLKQTGTMSFLGFRQFLETGKEDEPELVTNGLYRWIRHPLYTAGLAFIWLAPVMTGNLLALNLGITVYLVVGAMYEERKLVRVFGEEYVRYREHTPMLIPGLRR